MAGSARDKSCLPQTSTTVALSIASRCDQRNHQVQIAFGDQVPIVGGRTLWAILRHALAPCRIAEDSRDPCPQRGHLSILQEVRNATSNFGKRRIVERNDRSAT